jgi:uncharacterized protein (TIGR03067 family)
MDGDLAKLQGAWHIVTIEMDGQTAPAGNEAKIVIDGDRFTSLGMGSTYKGKIAVDATRRPKAFDLKFTSGPEKGNTNQGIYELRGDRWKICLDFRGQGRPTGFAAKPGSGYAVEVLRRREVAALPKSKTSAESAGMPTHPAPELEGEWAMLSCIQSGEPMPKAWLKFAKRTAVGNLITVTMNGQAVLKARFTVDRTQQPKTIDYIMATGPNSGQRQYGIYTFDGKTLTTCIAALGGPRPADFKAEAGDGRLLTSWRAVKPSPSRTRG